MIMAFAAGGVFEFIMLSNAVLASMVMFILKDKISIATPTIGVNYFVIANLVHS